MIELIKNDFKHPKKAEETQQQEDDEYELIKYSLLLRNDCSLIDFLERSAFGKLISTWLADTSNLTESEKKLNKKFLSIFKDLPHVIREDYQNDVKKVKEFLLGSVDKILEKPYKSSNKIEKTHKNLSSLVKSRKNAPKVLDFSKEAFNQMTFFVDMLIVIPLYFSIPFWWNNYYTSLAFKTCNKSITIVAFISHYSRVIDIFG